MLVQAELEPMDRPCSLEVDLLVFHSGDSIYVQGSARGSFWLTCSRCLGPCQVDLNEASVQMTFLPPPTSTEVEQEMELDLDDLNTACHDGVEVDLEPLLREHLVLAVPIKPVCRQQCKGICSACGADLNEETCGCVVVAEPVEESPWKRAMKQLKVETGGEN